MAIITVGVGLAFGLNNRKLHKQVATLQAELDEVGTGNPEETPQVWVETQLNALVDMWFQDDVQSAVKATVERIKNKK